MVESPALEVLEFAVARQIAVKAQVGIWMMLVNGIGVSQTRSTVVSADRAGVTR